MNRRSNLVHMERCRECPPLPNIRRRFSVAARRRCTGDRSRHGARARWPSSRVPKPRWVEPPRARHRVIHGRARDREHSVDGRAEPIGSERRCLARSSHGDTGSLAATERSPASCTGRDYLTSRVGPNCSGSDDAWAVVMSGDMRAMSVGDQALEARQTSAESGHEPLEVGNRLRITERQFVVGRFASRGFSQWPNQSDARRTRTVCSAPRRRIGRSVD